METDESILEFTVNNSIPDCFNAILKGTEHIVGFIFIPPKKPGEYIAQCFGNERQIKEVFEFLKLKQDELTNGNTSKRQEDKAA